jgi:putative FmdB family regulatory protein
MPIYAYKCGSCGHAKDVLQKLSDAPLSTCPACSEPTFTKQVTAAGFQLKGSGWYVTDFRGGPKDKADPGAVGGVESKAGAAEGGATSKEGAGSATQSSSAESSASNSTSSASDAKASSSSSSAGSSAASSPSTSASSSSGSGSSSTPSA